MRDVLLLFGMQGSGKGTQGERIMEKYGHEGISAGQLLRDKAVTDPRINEAQKRGVLVPDEIVETTVEEKIDSLDEDQRIFFDGFPRSDMQLEMYKRITERYDFKSLAIMIEIPEAEAIKRISTRYTCPSCGAVDFKPGKCKCGGELERREDDTEEAVKKRIEIFKADTAPLVEYFKDKGEYIEINGVGTFDEVTRRIFKELDKYYQE
ncbi:MAG: nucleoside monophosphate kinase [Patescibacteria group bacterium]